MKNKFCTIIFSTIVLFSPLSLAEKSPTYSIAKCDEAKLTAKKYSQCLDVVKERTEKELETWVNNQMFVLEELAKSTGRKSAYVMFQRSQKNFITYRENNCKWQFLVELPSSVAAPSYKKCFIMTSKDRINELSRISK